MAKSKEQISYNMSRVKSSGTMIERMLGSALWRAGIRYRKQYGKIPGRPDFALPGDRIAIFCDSSFWHGRGWPESAKELKTNKDFWIAKIEGNISRDRQVNEQLANMGWEVVRFWDFEILKATSMCVHKVLDLRASRRRLASNDKTCSG